MANNMVVLNQEHNKVITAKNISVESNRIFAEAECCVDYADGGKLQRIPIGIYKSATHAKIAFAELLVELSKGKLAIVMSKEYAKKQAKKAGISKDDSDADFVININRDKRINQVLDCPDDYDDDDCEDDDYDD